MTETITEAARRGAETRSRHLPGPMRPGYEAGFRHGAAWEREREPSDAEISVAAAMLVMLTVRGGGPDDSARDSARRILAAARAARQEAEG